MPLSFFGMLDERFAEEAVDSAVLKLLGRGAELAVCGAVLSTWSGSMDWLLSGARLWTWDLCKLGIHDKLAWHASTFKATLPTTIRLKFCHRCNSPLATEWILRASY